jgi:3-oxoacyl-(acyl-carrier-protein) synthase
MKPVYIAASSHLSARGAGLEAVRAIKEGDTSCTTRLVNGEKFPFFRLPLEGQWSQRARHALTLCHESLGHLPARDSLSVFFASSSFQLGEIETRCSSANANPFFTAGSPDMGSFVREAMCWLGIDALPWCFSSACTSSATAMYAALSLLRQGVINDALMITTELENELSLNGFHSLGLLAEGLVLGEAVAAVWLSTAKRCGGDSCWRLDACELGLDGFSASGVNSDGSVIRSVMERAMTNAGKASVDIIKVHTTGVEQTDFAEERALYDLFGANPPRNVSLKPYIGHTQGASTLVELALLLDCLEANCFPLIDKPRAVPPASTVLLNSMGFGGSISSLLLSRETE